MDEVIKIMQTFKYYLTSLDLSYKAKKRYLTIQPYLQITFIWGIIIQ